MAWVGIISDTHGFADPQLCKTFAHCQEIWHAGDVGGQDVMEQLSAIAPVRAVYGNIDGASLRYELPKDLFFTFQGLPVLMTHIAGQATAPQKGGSPIRYLAPVRELIALHQPALFIYGHSHILKIVQDPRHQMLCLNPGAAGKTGFHQVRTVVRAEITGGKITAMEVVELGKRA